MEGFEKGMRVRGGNTTQCYRCPMCLEGKYNLCENRVWVWGAYAECIKVPEPVVKHNMHIIPPHLSYAEVAITEPFVCVVHGELKARVKLGDEVAIIGIGPIGILHTQLAKKLGAKRVLISDIVEEGLKIAEKIGADETINVSQEDLVERIMELTGKRGVDVAVESIGLPQTWQQAIKLVKKGGTVLEFGGYLPGTKMEVDTELLHYRETTILGTFHASPEEFKIAFNLIASGAINVNPLITSRMPLT